VILHRSPGARLLRQLCAGSAALAVVQLLLLRQPDLGRMVAIAPSGLVLCIAFGLVAFLAWLLTEVRWPLVAWAVVVLLVAIDQTHQPQLGDRDDFGAFADGATVPAPLLSAHAPSQAPRVDRLSRNGD
jgi:hypothetical protein